MHLNSTYCILNKSNTTGVRKKLNEKQNFIYLICISRQNKTFGSFTIPQSLVIF